jgi:hypothetical protein
MSDNNLNEIIRELKSAVSYVNDVDIEVDEDSIEITSFNYDSYYGFSGVQFGCVELSYINGENPTGMLVISEAIFDSIMEKLEKIDNSCEDMKNIRDLAKRIVNITENC